MITYPLVVAKYVITTLYQYIYIEYREGMTLSLSDVPYNRVVWSGLYCTCLKSMFKENCYLAADTSTKWHIHKTMSTQKKKYRQSVNDFHWRF